MENGSIDIKIIDKNSKVLTEIYYLKESEGLKTNEIGNVSILFTLNLNYNKHLALTNFFLSVNISF